MTNAGGPAVLATDSLIASGGQLASLPADYVNELSGFLPPHWSRGNPIDLLGDASAETFGRAISIAARNPESDGILVVLSPQGMTDPAAVAEELIKHRPEDKPVLASWMGANSVVHAETILNQSGIPTFPYPDTAARAFTLMWRYSHNIDALYETPTLVADRANPLEDIETFLGDISAAGRTILTEVESKKLLAAYGISCVPTWVARTEDAAVAIAEDVGYPAVVKLHSETITDKSDVDGVRLNLLIPEKCGTHSAPSRGQYLNEPECGISRVSQYSKCGAGITNLLLAAMSMHSSALSLYLERAASTSKSSATVPLDYPL